MATTTTTSAGSETALSQTIDLATRIQRRRDFAAHLTGFVIGVAVLLVLTTTTDLDSAAVSTCLLMWATALSFQHFRHVFRGPVTSSDVTAEARRLDHRA